MWIVKGILLLLGGVIGTLLRGLIALAMLIGAAVTLYACCLEGDTEEDTKKRHRFVKLMFVVFVLLVFLKGFLKAIDITIFAFDIYGIYLYLLERKADKKSSAEYKKRDEEKAEAEKYCLEAEKFEHGTDGSEKDLVKARELYRKAAELGNKQAQLRYGWFCLKGMGGEKDPQAAFENLKKADEVDTSSGYDFNRERDNKYALGLCYCDGIGTAVDLSEALACFKSSGLKGEFNAAYRAAGIYKKMGNTESAEIWYGIAAENGHRYAMFEQAKMLMTKVQNIPALKEALQLLKAVKLSCANLEAQSEERIQKTESLISEEQKREAAIYFEHIAENKKVLEPEEAKKLYDDSLSAMSQQNAIDETIEEKIVDAASNAYAPAAFLLGCLMKRGLVKNDNPVIAVEWIRRAVEQGYIVDRMVDMDWLRTQDPELAARVLKLGEDAGCAFALYQQGHAAMQMGDEESAATLLEKAAALDDAAACYELAIWILKKNQGQQSEENTRRALSLLKRSAEQEHPEACYAMGLLAEKNRPDTAKDYFEIAAWNGKIPAMAKLALFYNTEDTLSDQLFWLDRMTFAGEYRLLPKMAKSHILYAMQLRDKISKHMGKDLSPAECKQNVELCSEALKELGKAYFWQKCLLKQHPDAEDRTDEILRMQEDYHSTLDTLNDLESYAYKKKRIDEEIEKTEREDEIRNREWERNERSSKLAHAAFVGMVFGIEAEAYALARDFKEEINEDPWLYCQITDIDPWLKNVL